MEKLDDNIYMKNINNSRKSSSNCPVSRSLSPVFMQDFLPIMYTVKPEASNDISSDLV